MNIHLKDPASQPVLDNICRVLSGILCDGVDVHRCLAARALGRIGAPVAVQPLIAALLDEDEDVRTDAAEALSEMADPRAARQLLENLLGDPCTDVKLAAIATLVKLKDRRVIPWLQRMVKGRDEEIVWDEEEFYASGWDDWVDIQIKAVDALADLNAGEAVPDILAAMRAEDSQDMTEAAFKALARMGRPGIEALACFLNEDSVRLRRRAAAALGACDDLEAEGPLERAFTDSSSEVRSAAMRALAARAPADGRLAVLLDDSDATVRTEAVRLYGTEHPDLLPDMIGDASKSVQLAALTVLESITNLPADKTLVTALREKLGNRAGDIAAAAARALAARAPPQAAVNDLISLLGDATRPVNARLGALQGLTVVGGDQAVEALAGMINDEERSIRLETMAALARLAWADAVWPNAAGDALLFALRDGYGPDLDDDNEDPAPAIPKNTDEETGEPASSAASEKEDDIGAFPTSTLSAMLNDVPEAREVAGLPHDGVELTPVDMERLALAKRIKGKRRMQLVPEVVLHKDIRSFAIRVLGDLYHADVAHELAGVLKNKDAGLCMAAADSLARIGEQLNPLPDSVTEVLMDTAATANRDLKLLLIRALGAAGNKAVPAFLSGQINDEDSFVQVEAVRALSRMGQANSEVVTLLGDPDPSVRLSAAQAIAAANDTDAVTQLVDFALSYEGYHGRQAARLLRDLDPGRASTLFIEVLLDPERKRTWSVAIEALEELNCSQPVRTAEVTDREGQG